MTTPLSAIEYVDKLRSLASRILRAASERLEGGAKIDDYQVLTRRLAGMATHLEVGKSLAAFGRRVEDTSKPDLSILVEMALLDIAYYIERDLRSCAGELELDLLDVPSVPPPRSGRYQELGKSILEAGPDYVRPILNADGVDEDAIDLRASTRRFARSVVAPRAEEVHRNDLLVPEEFIQGMAELGYFGMSVPEKYGGVGASNLMMVVATEELSAASLATAGSLITRPEILTKALIAGGTDEQRAHWLPRIASGEVMVAISVTEPNVGSDVASVTCRADSTEGGYLINGAKAWCTFAGRADIIALLARTDPDASSGHKGLSLFIVEKDRFDGHGFVMTQPGGGRLVGKADATPGYRGMHSYTLQFEDYFVPENHLVGGEGGLGKGFYLQMGGFAAGRLQTGGRAVGLAQASLAAAINYANERPQFGRPIAAFQNTQYEIGCMVCALEAARQLTYFAATAMDGSAKNASILAAMAKLYASRVAVDVSQRAQLLHGGWGYAEEYPISRYVVDALVLPIFEGVEPILEMKVIGRGILADPGLLA
jgi:(2S)-methylsuccinyl-CoA dehydrogenase